MKRHPDSRPLWFSQVHLSNFERRSCTLSLRYTLVFFQLGFSGLLVLAEIFVATSLILHKNWVQRVVYVGLDHSQTALPVEISSPDVHALKLADIFKWTGIAAGWITAASLGLTVCVLVWGWIRATSVVKSDNILQAFLNSSAYQLWTIKSYTHFCLLSEIKWGRSIRQRIVLMVYFGLQGFSALLVALPRLAVYACVVYAAKNLPGMGTTALGLQQLGLSGYTGQDGWPLMLTLGIMTLSTVVHTLQLIKIMLSATMCVFSLCYLGRIKRTMARDIEFRITSLVVSRCEGTGTNSRDAGARLSADSHKPDLALHLDHTSREAMSAPNVSDQDRTANEITEKVHSRDAQDFAFHRSEPTRVNTHQLDLGQGANTNNESAGLGLYAVSTVVPLAYHSQKGGDVAAMPQHEQHVSPFDERHGMGSSVPTTRTQVAQFSPSTTIPIQQSTAMNGSAGAAAYATRLPYGDRMATLSFYDDLLATISSERLIYTTSLSNQSNPALLRPCHSTEKSAKMDCNSSVLSLQSSALCSSMQLTYGSNNENTERSILSRPIHPFDTFDTTDPAQTSVRLPSRSSSPFKESHDANIDNTPSDMMDVSNGFRTGYSSCMNSQENLQNQNTYVVQKRSSRCDSSLSQDIIENWRIHVAPSPPTIPELYDDTQEPFADRKCASMGNQTDYSSRDIGMDMNHHSSTGNPDRRGTIPIILSSHLQDARTTNFVDEQYFFSIDDLEAPRPPYAYSQTRTQRQGSVNSSIGGYNYSTAASSPSLADSLSNPMYQQQSFGIMNNSIMLQPRPLAPRKGSLPTLLCSKPVMDDLCLIPGDSQLHGQQRSFVGSVPVVSSNIRSNTPSQLSNIIVHSGNIAGYGLDVDTPVPGEPKEIPSQHQRGHVRSQSQDVRSSGSSWDQTGIEDAKAGYTTLMNIPAVTPSHMGYYSVQDDLLVSHPALRSSGIMGSREDLTINDGSANYSRNTFGPWPSQGEGQQYSTSNIYRNDMSDNMVHPLDLSPLLLQTHSGAQQEFERSNIVASHGGVLRQDQAWDDTCIGLGLTFDLDHHSVPDSSDNEGSIFIHYPHERPVTGTSTASGFLTHAAPLHRTSYSTYHSVDMTTATTSSIFDTDSFRPPTGTPTPVDNVDSVGGIFLHRDDYPPLPLTESTEISTAIEGRCGRPPQVQRQSSQRNKKNLIVNIVPL